MEEAKGCSLFFKKPFSARSITSSEINFD